MKVIIAIMAVALSLCACSTPVSVTAPSQPPQVSEPAPAPAPAERTKGKKKKVKSEPRKESKPVRTERKVDCVMVRWAVNTFSEERLKTLEGQASAEQKRRAKACLSQ